MTRGFSIDPRQQLSAADQERLVRLAAELGYTSAWTPSGPDAAAIEGCIRVYQVSGLPTGTNVVPVAGLAPETLAEWARRAHEETDGTFTLGVGPGQVEHSGPFMRDYLPRLLELLPDDLRLMVAALGPLMLRLGGEQADAVALNWCSAPQVAWSRERIEASAQAAGREVPLVVEYIRTSVDPDAKLARRTLGEAALMYALGPPAYRKHFERMGFAAELERIQRDGLQPSDELLAAAGAAGAPGAVKGQFEALAEGLDLPIVRVLVTQPGDAESAERVLRECAPKP